jgi:sugar phosphate isomerase/epimerase
MTARLTLSTGSLYGYPLPRVMATAAALGLDGVEVLLDDVALASGPAALAALAKGAGAPILSVHFAFMGCRTDADVYDAYEQAAAVASELPECEAAVVHTSIAPTLHGAAGHAYLQALRRSQQRLRRHGVRLSIENRGVGVAPARPAYLDDLVNLRRLAEEWDFGLTYDIGHAASWGLDITRALVSLGPRVHNIHLSNSRARGWPFSLPFVHSHLRDHQPLDAGDLPIVEFLAQLAVRRYAGLITLELSPLALHLPLPWRARERLADSVSRCRAALAVAEAEGRGVRGEGRGEREVRSEG